MESKLELAIFIVFDVVVLVLGILILAGYLDVKDSLASVVGGDRNFAIIIILASIIVGVVGVLHSLKKIRLTK